MEHPSSIFKYIFLYNKFPLCLPHLSSYTVPSRYFPLDRHSLSSLYVCTPRTCFLLYTSNDLSLIPPPNIPTTIIPPAYICVSVYPNASEHEVERASSSSQRDTGRHFPSPPPQLHLIIPLAILVS